MDRLASDLDGRGPPGGRRSGRPQVGVQEVHGDVLLAGGVGMEGAVVVALHLERLAEGADPGRGRGIAVGAEVGVDALDQGPVIRLRRRRDGRVERGDDLLRGELRIPPADQGGRRPARGTRRPCRAGCGSGRGNPSPAPGPGRGPGSPRRARRNAPATASRLASNRDRIAARDGLPNVRVLDQVLGQGRRTRCRRRRPRRSARRCAACR